MTTMMRLRTFGRRACLQAAFWLKTATDHVCTLLDADDALADGCARGEGEELHSGARERATSVVPCIERPNPEHLDRALKVLEAERRWLSERHSETARRAEALRESEELAELPDWMDNDLTALIAERCALDDVRHFLEQLASATEAAPFRCLVVEGNYDVASSVVVLPLPPSARERVA